RRVFHRYRSWVTVRSKQRRLVGQRQGGAQEAVCPLLREWTSLAEHDRDVRVAHLRTGEHLGHHRRRDVSYPEHVRPTVLDHDGGARHRRQLAEEEEQTAVDE